MFSKKNPKPQSTSKLLYLLTKRSSLKKTSTKRGLYDEWPTSEKPSLLNCSTNYIRYLSVCNSQHKDPEPHIDKKRKPSSFAKKPATFSTCTTMEFFPTTQHNIHAQSKFTATPKSQQSNQDNQANKMLKFTPYMTPLKDSSQFFDQNDSNLRTLNDEEYDGKLISRYDQRPQTVNFTKKAPTQERRLIKTAKIHRQNLQKSKIDQQSGYCNKTFQSKSNPTSNGKETSGRTPTQPLIRSNNTKSQTIRTNASMESLGIDCNYPMRLKDYETNFQAYKLVSELIDQQMKWQPKRAKPKSSVMFRKYNLGTKA